MKSLKEMIRTMSKTILLSALGLSLIAPSVLADTQAVPASQPNSVSAAPNPANAKISKDQAVEITRKLIPGLKEATVRSVDYGQPNVYPQRNEDIWSIQWEIRKENSSYGFTSTVDAINGELLQVYLPNYNQDPANTTYYPPKVSKEGAQKLAKDFIAKAAPSVAIDSITIDEESPYYISPPSSLFGPVQYNFNFYPTLNGVPFRTGRISVTMDGDGNVTQFYKQQFGELPSSKPAVTLEQATAYAKEHQEVHLQYIPVRNMRGKTESYWLGYTPSMQPVDAQTGQFASLGPVPVKETFEPVPVTDNAFKPRTGTEELTAEEAAEIVVRVVPSLNGKTLQQKSLSSDWRGDTKVWQLSFADKDQQMPFGSPRATVDARTGVILDYNSNVYGPFPGPAKPGEPTITKEEALKRAEAFINAAYPNASKELMRKETTDKVVLPPSYSFSFSRFHKGLPIFGESVNVMLDLQGNVVQYYGYKNNLDEQAMDALKQNISEQEALKKIWEDTKIEMQYLSIYGTPMNGFEQAKVKLVYNQSFKNVSLNGKALDATDGSWKPIWSGQPDFKSAAGKPEDIEGHWAQKDLETLLNYQVLATDNEGKLNPDQPITYGDWITMMAAAVSPYYKGYYSGDGNDKTLFADVKEGGAYYQAVRMFVQMKWLTADTKKTLGVDNNITREGLASSLLQIVKYNKLSGLIGSNLKMPSFTDSVEISSKSDVALAVYLGLMTGSDGAFKPKDKVTKAEAASVIMRLVQLQGKLDQRIGQ